MWGHQRLSICHDELQRMSRILPCQKLISESNKLVSKASKLVSKAVDGSGNPSTTSNKFLTRELAYWQNRSAT